MRVEAQHLVGMIREKMLNSLRHVMPAVVWWVGLSSRINIALASHQHRIEHRISIALSIASVSYQHL